MKNRQLRRRDEFPAVAEFKFDLNRIETGVTRANQRCCSPAATMAFAHRFPSPRLANFRDLHEVTWIWFSVVIV